jgi:hypothetical protein
MSDKRATFQRLSDIEPRDVEWLWPNYIPRGLLTVVEGDPNVGKSYLVMHISAQVTIGGSIRGTSIPSGRVLYLSTEDEPDYTIRPRLEAMGADLARVRVLTSGSLLFDEDGLLLLREEMQLRPAMLIVVDTLFSFMPSGVDTNKPTDVRAVLSGVREIAREFRAAIVLIRHWTKGARDGKAIYRGSGSIDIIGLARAGVAVAKHPEDSNLRVVAHVKYNLSAPEPSLVFALKEKPDSLPVVEWHGETHLSADDLQGVPTAQPKALESTLAFLEEQLRGRSRPAKLIMEKAKQLGLSQRTLDRAKQELRVSTRKSRSGWIWSLPAERAPK